MAGNNRAYTDSILKVRGDVLDERGERHEAIKKLSSERT